jgi:hypothetical protein
MNRRSGCALSENVHGVFSDTGRREWSLATDESGKVGLVWGKPVYFQSHYDLASGHDECNMLDRWKRKKKLLYKYNIDKKTVSLFTKQL